MHATALRFMGWGVVVSLGLTGCEGGVHSASADEYASTRTQLQSGTLTLGKGTSVDFSGYGYSEHCHVPQAVLTQLGSGVGRQLRVRMGSGAALQEGLCTVTRATDGGTVVMHGEGISRLDMAEDAGVVLSAMHGAASDRNGVTWHAPTDTEATLNNMQVTKPNDVIERLADDGQNDTLIYTAPHGGNIEMKTSDQVELIAPVATSKVSTWRVKGWHSSSGDAKNHWHITSTDFNEHSFPSLGAVMGRDFRYAVSFHGYKDDPELPIDILVGGREDLVFREGVAEVLDDALRGSNLVVEPDPPTFKGNEESNFINRLAKDRKGLQLEQSATARNGYSTAIANAVKAHYTCLIDTTAEDTLTVSGAAAQGHSDGIVYHGTGCTMYAADVTVTARPVTTTYSVTASTPLAGLSQEDCAKTEWYLSLYRWSQTAGRYHRVGGTRGKGAYVSGACQPVFKDSTYGAVTFQAPLGAAPADTYRAVAWARRYTTTTNYTALPVSVNVGP
ncbi:hypothetical protein HPC49_36930 [Pyxidicoccus fallax]|uniref:Lipoprotein n=1 Tax=Pyxidicoccus fallax TaxID=394095 RepID=A0A848LX41_9BACT|nr:poly-gamma-glutamate hydrolase family protein [Pyxidicoccus fallax]NMO22170.1 hypothetical protein [Pyxidicoccus fallax]NPC83791.1 hypothetical protein [Pyxidicoccus fallax]